MKNKNLFFSAILVLAVSLVMTACNKSASVESPLSNGKQELTLFLTDGPGVFDKVLIDIRSVKVLVDTSSDTRKHDNDDWDKKGEDDNKKESSFVWEDLNFKAGIYDILKFRNGADTLLAAAGIAKGSIRLIKIEIGTQNSAMKDSVSYPLNLPPNALNYILIKLKGNECHEFMPNRKKLWLDFDVARSIIQGNDNKFYLRPVFHFFTLVTTGSIAGKVGPADGKAVITVYNATDTAYGLPNKEGYFKLRGLKDGTYSVFVNASNGYADTTLKNVSVTAPKETSVGVITLHK